MFPILFVLYVSYTILLHVMEKILLGGCVRLRMRLRKRLRSLLCIDSEVTLVHIHITGLGSTPPPGHGLPVAPTAVVLGGPVVFLGVLRVPIRF